MNKKELVADLAVRSENTKAATERFLDEFAELVVSVVAGGGVVRVPGLGTWDSVERAEREGRNPSTGNPMTIPRRTAPRFKFSKRFKTVVAGV